MKQNLFLPSYHTTALMTDETPQENTIENNSTPLSLEPQPEIKDATRTRILLLTSHAYTPPLRPAPHLRYDLRAVQNPPKALRDAGYTGQSKRLREHLRGNADFIALLEKAEGEIRTALEPWTLAREEVVGDESAKEGGEGEEVFSVGVFCARGRHRSVAFVEELTAVKWPGEWQVRVVHRELQRGGERRMTKRGKRGRRGFEFALGGHLE